ncbi:TRAM domain-containing protein [Nanoarchaeota archaeon]
MQGGFRNFAPVKVGEEIDVKVEAVGEKGDGIAKVKGFVLFIPNVKEGDEVKVRITKVLRKVGFADVVGEASGPVETEAQEGGVQEVEEVEPSPEDSEDFGEEETPVEEMTTSEAAEEEKKE